MNPGELNRKVTIQGIPAGKDSEGNELNGYEDKFSLWAAINQITASEAGEQGEIKHIISTEIIIRYDTRLAINDRVVYNGHVYEQIGPPINIGWQNAYWLLTCREVAGAYNG